MPPNTSIFRYWVFLQLAKLLDEIARTLHEVPTRSNPGTKWRYRDVHRLPV